MLSIDMSRHNTPRKLLQTAIREQNGWEDLFGIDVRIRVTVSKVRCTTKSSVDAGKKS